MKLIINDFIKVNESRNATFRWYHFEYLFPLAHFCYCLTHFSLCSLSIPTEIFRKSLDWYDHVGPPHLRYVRNFFGNHPLHYHQTHNDFKSFSKRVINETIKLKGCNVNEPLLTVHNDSMCLWDLRNSGEIFVLWQGDSRRFWGNKKRLFLLSRVIEAKAILLDRTFTWWICKLAVFLVVDWNLSSPCYLHSTQPVLHHPCSYRKTVGFYFLCLSATVSGLVYCIHSVI